MKHYIGWIFYATVMLFVLRPSDTTYAQGNVLANFIPDPTCVRGLDCEQLVPFDVASVQIEADGEISKVDVAELETSPSIGANVILIDLPQQIRVDRSVMDGITVALQDLNQNFGSLGEDELNSVPWFIYGFGVEGNNDLFPIRTVNADGTINAYRGIDGIGYEAINDLVSNFINDYRNNGGNDKTGFIDPFLAMLDEVGQIQSIVCICEGVDGAGSSRSISDVIQAAQQKGTPIHAYQLGAERVNTDAGRVNLEVLARETGGQFIPYNESLGFDPNAFAPIWTRVGRAMNPYVVPFTLPNADVRDATLTITLDDGTSLTKNVSVTPGTLSLTIEELLINGQSGEGIEPIAADATEIAIELDVNTEDGQPITDEREPSIQIEIGNWNTTVNGTSGTLKLTPLVRAALEETSGLIQITVQDKYEEEAAQEITLQLSQPELPPTVTFPDAIEGELSISYEAETAEPSPEEMGSQDIKFSVTDAEGNKVTPTEAICLFNGEETAANLETQSCSVALDSLIDEEGTNELLVTTSTEKFEDLQSEKLFIDFTLVLPPVVEPDPSLAVTVVNNEPGLLELRAELTPWKEVSAIKFALLNSNGESDNSDDPIDGEVDGQSLTISIPVEEAGNYYVKAIAEFNDGTAPIESPTESVTLSILPAAIPWRFFGLSALIPVLALIYWLWKRNQEADDDEWDDLLVDPIPRANMHPDTDPQTVSFGTEPVPTMDIFPRATLVWTRGGNNLPEEILLPGHQRDGLQLREWKIGRLHEFSDYIIDDPCISKIHITISEKNGEFYIKDELSSGKTYLNRRLLPPGVEEHLSHNDVINLNAVAYRFTLEDDDPAIYGIHERDFHDYASNRQAQQPNSAPPRAQETMPREEAANQQIYSDSLPADPFGTEPTAGGNETNPISSDG